MHPHVGMCCQVAPQDGFEPSWRAALIAAVVIIAFIIAALLFVALASFRRQRLLLQETVVSLVSHGRRKITAHGLTYPCLRSE